MRVAVGVLLLVAALAHGCSGAALVVMGATTEGIAVGSAASEPHAANPQQKRGLELAAGAIIVVGFVLLVAVAIEIGGAVQLFRARRSWLPLGAGLVGLAIAGLLAAF